VSPENNAWNFYTQSPYRIIIHYSETSFKDYGENRRKNDRVKWQSRLRGSKNTRNLHFFAWNS